VVVVGEGRGEEGKRLFFLVVVGFVSHGDGRQFSQTTTTIRVGECSRDRIKTNLARRKQTRNFPKTRWRGNETHSPGRFRNVESGAHHIQPYFTVREPSLLFGTLGRGQSASNPAPLVHNHMQNMQCYGQTAPRSITFRRPLVNRRWGPKAPARCCGIRSSGGCVVRGCFKRRTYRIATSSTPRSTGQGQLINYS
jgi:hypothetical protein